MRRGSPWIRCRGAGISAACRGRATCRWSNTSARCGSIGYDGVLSLEIFNDRFRAGSTADVALDGMRSLDYLREQVERVAATPATPDPRTACKGIEFIEFSASEEEAKQLGQMLRTLGFAPTHRHVRKAVTRWRQGDINLVVNCEPDGFAHSYDTVHGASVCAIGLRVADPEAALRAREPAAGAELLAARGARRV